MTVFLEIASDLDLVPRTLKVELARDIVNICVKFHYNPSINVGARAMTMFFLKIVTMTLTLSPGP